MVDAEEREIKRRPGRKKRPQKPKDPRYAGMVTPIMRNVDPEKRRLWAAMGGRASRRLGVPDGITKEDAASARSIASEEARLIVDRMRGCGLLDLTEAGDEMLEFVIAVVRANVDPIRERSKAAELVLTYVKAKPAQPREVKISVAEDWLSKLLEADA